MSKDESEEAYLEGNILYIKADQEYDKQEIDRLLTLVSSLIKGLDNWAFYQRVDPDMGISTSGVDSLCQHYLGLEKQGCRALAVECEKDNLYVDIIFARLPKELTLPIKISSNSSRLMAFIEDNLS